MTDLYRSPVAIMAHIFSQDKTSDWFSILYASSFCPFILLCVGGVAHPSLILCSRGFVIYDNHDVEHVHDSFLFRTPSSISRMVTRDHHLNLALVPAFSFSRLIPASPTLTLSRPRSEPKLRELA